MPTENFNGKKIKIRPLSKKDLKSPKKFQDYINSLVEEDAKIKVNKRKSLKEEVEWLKDSLKKIKKHQGVYLVAKDNDVIVGSAGIGLKTGRQSHVGVFGITIRKGYRKIGLGTYLTQEIIKLAKRDLKSLRNIRLGVMNINKPAIALYRKFGFKKVALLPKQMEYKGKLRDEIIMLLYL